MERCFVARKHKHYFVVVVDWILDSDIKVFFWSKNDPEFSNTEKKFLNFRMNPMMMNEWMISVQWCYFILHWTHHTEWILFTHRERKRERDAHHWKPEKQFTFEMRRIGNIHFDSFPKKTKQKTNLYTFFFSRNSLPVHHHEWNRNMKLLFVSFVFRFEWWWWLVTI